jgi:hypothetical protein
MAGALRRHRQALTVAVTCLACEVMRKLLRVDVQRADASLRASSLANPIRNLYPFTEPSCQVSPAGASLHPRVHCQQESDMKGLEKKKETKKKPQKSLKEKRAEKNAKKADRT